MAAIRILLVEDEALSSMLIARRLEEFGYIVAQHAESGDAAIEMARRDPPDLIVMDIGLPGRIDGIEAASIIQSECGAMILFITGYEDPATLARAALLRPLGYLPKPLDFGRLRAVIEGSKGA